MGYRRLGISIRIIAVRSIFKGIIRRALRIATAAAWVVAAACGGKSGPGPSPATQPPQIACPSEVTVRGVVGSAAATFPDPTVTGGAAPVNTTCTRASGTSFPIGTTAVSCTAQDAQSRQATCSFNVTLTGVSLAVTKYGAYGDSLTEGETGRPNLFETLLDIPNAYPTRLQAAFDQNYPGQGVTVINRGHSGDSVDTTDAAIRRFLPTDRPGAALVLTGFNDLTGPCTFGQSGTAACRNAADQKVPVGLRDCIRHIREANAGVQFIFVSTLTPPGPTGSQRIDPNAIVQANARIRQIAAAEGVVLVDAHAAFVAHEAEYVNVDGLHLRPAGYQALADAFFAAIKATIPQTPLGAVSR